MKTSISILENRSENYSDEFNFTNFSPYVSNEYYHRINLNKFKFEYKNILMENEFIYKEVYLDIKEDNYTTLTYGQFMNIMAENLASYRRVNGRDQIKFECETNEGIKIIDKIRSNNLELDKYSEKMTEDNIIKSKYSDSCLVAIESIQEMYDKRSLTIKLISL